MLLTTSEAAKRLDCSPDNVRRLEREGKLPATKTTTGQRLFTSEDIDCFAQERTQTKGQRQQAKTA
jgi:excisionase family DNA binding protein